VGWFSSVPKICYCTSPQGYWCTRTDRHATHEATGGMGCVYLRWRGDFPSDTAWTEDFTGTLTHRDYNDLMWGVR
jgi:hypothetical protein